MDLTVNVPKYTNAWGGRLVTEVCNAGWRGAGTAVRN
jgi:hypothetical protein